MGIEVNMNIAGRIKEAGLNKLQGVLQITPDNICRYVYPLVQDIHSGRPDYIIAIDSGARITGLAVHLLYQKIYGALPSKDHSVHFRKVSHFSSVEVNRKVLKPDVEGMLLWNSSPQLFVIDDWINTGMTQRMVKHLISDLSNGRVRVRFGVMRELFTGIADVSGAKFSGARTTWRDNATLIGVDHKEAVPWRINSPEALILRRQVSSSIDKFINARGLQINLKEHPRNPKDLPLSELIQKTVSIQRSLDKELTRTVIKRSVDSGIRVTLLADLSILDEYKYELAQRFEDPNLPGYEVEPVNKDQLRLTYDRLMRIMSLPDGPNLMKPFNLGEDPGSATFYFPQPISGVIGEALATLPFREKVVGLRIEDKQEGQWVVFLIQEDAYRLSEIKFGITVEEKKNLALLRQAKKILIAVEGDIAGHAVRALMTARGLRDIGYEPRIIGTGAFMKHFEDAGFDCSSPFDTRMNEERNRLIAYLKGEGSGLFPWGFSTVGSKIKAVQNICAEDIQSGLDLLLSDMNPIAAIALEQLSRKFDRPFAFLTQTHDMRFSPERSLRALKFKGISFGFWSERVKDSQFFTKLDPQHSIYGIGFRFLEGVIDVIAGLPLVLQDRKYILNGKFRFTDYLYGKDGTLFFSFEQVPDKTDGYYLVGMQADRGEVTDNIYEISGTPFILHAQGSTYHQKAWEVVRGAVTEISNSYSIHATGRREERSAPIYRDSGKNPAGMTVGYVNGFSLSSRVDVYINHGGFGSISQWLLSNAERLITEREVLRSILHSSDTSEIRRYLQALKGLSRSISICNTFEQENNARILNQKAGDNVCTVLIADELVEDPNAKRTLRNLIESKIKVPINNKELDYWVQLVDWVSTMNAPIQAALIAERVMASDSHPIK